MTGDDIECPRCGSENLTLTGDDDAQCGACGYIDGATGAILAMRRDEA